MATISNTPRPGYVWDSTDNVWYPIGTGPHTHADYITSGSAINPNIVDAKGDIIAATAADTVARLAVGSNDQVLTADSSTATGLKWATPSAGGMTLINTGGTTLTGSSVTISSIPATYKNLQLVIQNFKPATDDDALCLRLNGDSTANRYVYTTTNPLSGESPSENQLALGNNDNSVSQSLVIVNFFDYSNTVTWKVGKSFYWGNNATTSTSLNFSERHLMYNQTGAISSILIRANSGNLTSGTAYLYGVS